MQLRFSTWPEVERYLAARTDILLPIGATEQHGPYGLIGTDSLCAEGVAVAAGERAGVIVAPVLGVGMSLHHLAFPGSMSLQPSTMIAVLRDWADSLARHGFRRLHFVNGHGGNIATSQAAFSEIHDRHPQLRCTLSNWYELPAVRAIVQEQIGDAEGAHATPSELSLSWALHPQHQRQTAPQDPAPLIMGFCGAEDFRARFPDGRIGADQHRASVALGGLLHQAAVEDLLRVHEAWLQQG
jgi:creatinine amidohydrolase